jgi:hypothetical protein
LKELKGKNVKNLWFAYFHFRSEREVALLKSQLQNAEMKIQELEAKITTLSTSGGPPPPPPPPMMVPPPPPPPGKVSGHAVVPPSLNSSFSMIEIVYCQTDRGLICRITRRSTEESGY